MDYFILSDPVYYWTLRHRTAWINLAVRTWEEKTIVDHARQILWISCLRDLWVTHWPFRNETHLDTIHTQTNVNYSNHAHPRFPKQQYHDLKHAQVLHLSRISPSDSHCGDKNCYFFLLRPWKGNNDMAHWPGTRTTLGSCHTKLIVSELMAGLCFTENIYTRSL